MIWRGNSFLDHRLVLIPAETVEPIANYAAHLGLPVPEKIKAVLEQLHDRAEDKEDK